MTTRSKTLPFRNRDRVQVAWRGLKRHGWVTGGSTQGKVFVRVDGDSKRHRVFPIAKVTMVEKNEDYP